MINSVSFLPYVSFHTKSSPESLKYEPNKIHSKYYQFQCKWEYIINHCNRTKSKVRIALAVREDRRGGVIVTRFDYGKQSLAWPYGRWCVLFSFPWWATINYPNEFAVENLVFEHYHLANSIGYSYESPCRTRLKMCVWIRWIYHEKGVKLLWKCCDIIIN